MAESMRAWAASDSANCASENELRPNRAMVRSRSQRQLLCIGQHLVAAPAAAGQAPLGSLEQPQLRAMTVAELDPALSERGGRGEAAD
jgi:hypothetical protein